MLGITVALGCQHSAEACFRMNALAEEDSHSSCSKSLTPKSSVLRCKQVEVYDESGYVRLAIAEWRGNTNKCGLVLGAHSDSWAERRGGKSRGGRERP